MSKSVSLTDFARKKKVANRLSDFMDILEVEHNYAIQTKNKALICFIKELRKNPVYSAAVWQDNNFI